MVHMVQPEYPSQAKRAYMQGTVILHAIIGTDGSVHELQIVRGQCWLAKAAVKAVQKWRYTPTLLEGKPVKVDTTISVMFNLGR